MPLLSSAISAASQSCANTPTKAAYALLSVATNETSFAKGQKPQERTEWHRIVTWGRTAAACAEHLDVGRQVLVRGRLRTRSWPTAKASSAGLRRSWPIG